MIFFNKQSFLYAFLIVSLGRICFIFPSDLPVIEFHAPADFITPEFKSRKRAKSTIEKDEITKFHKQKKDHENNQASAEKIENLFKRERLNSISSPEVKSLTREIDYMKLTPESTKNRVAVHAMTRALCEITLDDDLNITVVEKNNKIASAMKSSSAEVKIASKCASILSSPEVRKRAVIDLHHIMNPTCSYHEDKSLKSISGGHVLQNYYFENLLEEDETVFIGQDNETLGVCVSGKVSKTLRSDITELSILDDLQYGVTVAKSPDDRRFKVTKVAENRYCGSCQHPENSLLYLTQFPLLVIHNKEIDENNEIYLGGFTQLKKDGTVDKRFKHQKEFKISVDVFHDVMKTGKKFISDENKIIVVEITEQLNEHFKEELNKLGKDSFPAPIYGIHEF